MTLFLQTSCRYLPSRSSSYSFRDFPILILKIGKRIQRISVSRNSNVRYSNYDASSPQIQWFWRAVRSFDKEERAKLLQFATGTSKVPLNGFKELEGMQGTIHPLSSNNRHYKVYYCQRLWSQDPTSSESHLLQSD